MLLAKFLDSDSPLSGKHLIFSRGYESNIFRADALLCSFRRVLACATQRSSALRIESLFHAYGSFYRASSTPLI